MMDGGYFKFWRELMNKPIWQESTPEQKVILVTLMGMANYEENKWEWNGKQFTCKPGQFVTSIDRIVEKCGKGVTNQNVRTALKRFEKYEFLTDESTNTGRLITIVNWGFYQGSDNKPNKATNRHLTGTSQAPNKQPNTYKEYKNIRNKEIKNIAPSAIESCEDEDDDGMDPMECKRLWEEQQKKLNS